MLVKSMLATAEGDAGCTCAVADVSTLLPIEETTAPVIVGLVNVGLVNVLPVSVCVAARPTSVSVTAGSVSVLVPATAGASIVTDPDVEPLSFYRHQTVSKIMFIILSTMCYRKER